MGGLVSSTFLSLFVIPGLLVLGARIRPFEEGPAD